MKPTILFRWSDSSRPPLPDSRPVVAAIIRAHRRGMRRGETAFVRYERAARRIECGSTSCPDMYGIWTRA